MYVHVFLIHMLYVSLSLYCKSLSPPTYICTYICYPYICHSYHTSLSGMSASRHNTVRCSVLQCVAVCCSVLHSAAVYCDELHCVCHIYMFRLPHMCVHMSFIQNVIRSSLSCYECLVLPTNMCAYTIHTHAIHLSLSLLKCLPPPIYIHKYIFM